MIEVVPIPPAELARLAEIEHVARALFLAEHPDSKWSAGRARAIWFSRAETAIDAVRQLAPQPSENSQ